MDLNKFGKRAFLVALKRCKISETTSEEVRNQEMCEGINEEVSELLKASERFNSEHLPKQTEVVEELADIAIASMTELYRRGVDIENVLHEKMKFNEKRD